MAAVFHARQCRRGRPDAEWPHRGIRGEPPERHRGRVARAASLPQPDEPGRRRGRQLLERRAGSALAERSDGRYRRSPERTRTRQFGVQYAGRAKRDRCGDLQGGDPGPATHRQPLRRRRVEPAFRGRDCSDPGFPRTPQKGLLRHGPCRDRSMSKHHTLVIAEACVNHSGSLETALALVDAAADAGADVVKFQTFSANSLVGRSARKADYQQRTTDASESQHAMLQRLELPQSAHHTLIAHARRRGIEFLSTPFDQQSLEFLVSLDLPRIKIGSGDLTNAPLLHSVAKAGATLILSTGMATLGEVEEALGVLAHGYSGSGQPPGIAAFRAAWRDPAAREHLARHVSLLHCTTEYPCPPGDVNLAAMAAM